MKKNKVHPIDLSYNFTEKLKDEKGLGDNKTRNSLERSVFDKEIMRYQQEYIHVLENVIDKKIGVNLFDLRKNLFK